MDMFHTEQGFPYALTSITDQQRRDPMKRFMILGAATLMSSAAIAQSIELAPEQRTLIKEYVTTHQATPVTVKERVSIGSTLPTSVRLQAVPPTWGPSVVQYQYVYTDNHIALVEPSSRKVVEIID